MKEVWQKIEDWIKDHYPPMIDTLNESANEEDLIQLESILGLKLPKDFREFLSIHNGQSWTHLKLFNGDKLLSIDEIISEWQVWNSVLPIIDADCREQSGQPASSEPEQGIKDNWWNASWIPITSDGSGDSYCIDMDPTPDGQVGQIIRMWHDHPRRELIAPSFHNWVNKYVTDLENGVYTFSEDIGFGGIITKEDE